MVPSSISNPTPHFMHTRASAMLEGETHPYFPPFPDLDFPLAADFFPALVSFLAAAFFAAGLPLVTPLGAAAAAELSFAGRPAPLRAPSEAAFFFLEDAWSGTSFSGRCPVAERVLRSVGVAGLGLPPRSLKLPRREAPPGSQRPEAAAATHVTALPSLKHAAMTPASSRRSQVFPMVHCVTVWAPSPGFRTRRARNSVVSYRSQDPGPFSNPPKRVNRLDLPALKAGAALQSPFSCGIGEGNTGMDDKRPASSEGYEPVDGLGQNLGSFHVWLTDKSGEVGYARSRRRRLLVAGAAASLAGVACASLVSVSPGRSTARSTGDWGRSVELEGLGAAAPGPASQGGCPPQPLCGA